MSYTQQLKMIRRSGPVKQVPLPEGYTFEYFTGLREQIEDWIEICREGLISPLSGEEAFMAAIANYPDLKPAKDLVFVRDGKGERVATIAFVLHSNGAGYVHMVCCKKAHRGRGIGDAMNSFALSRLEERGAAYSYLTTDDFRLGAVKTYLRAGFEPCIDTDEMRERWDNVLSKLGVSFNEKA
ncbi:MAG: GNAT family N-acetyltransferase [Clostridia bacterium]|nr:GNAT family N-acetyltransferase [Clostridia bacterium]